MAETTRKVAEPKEAKTMKLLAFKDVTVHKLLGEETPGEPAAVETLLMSEGQYIDEMEVPNYVRDAVKAGDVAGIVRVSEADAEKAAKDVADRAASGDVIQANP